MLHRSQVPGPACKLMTPQTNDPCNGLITDDAVFAAKDCSFVDFLIRVNDPNDEFELCCSPKLATYKISKKNSLVKHDKTFRGIRWKANFVPWR